MNADVPDPLATARPSSPGVPGEQAIAALPGPRSILRRRLSDPRAAAGAAGYALTMQVAHPVIAAGVRDHSTFASDPWGRFFRTADYVLLLGYGDAATVAELARNLRAVHGSIRGTDPRGNPYRALDPAAYAWVHATIAEAIVRAHHAMGTTLHRDEREEFWAEWLALGDVLKVSRRELPDSWAGVGDYFAEMIEQTLENNDVVQSLRATRRFAVGGSPFGWLPSPVWAAAGVPIAPVLHFLGVGLLPAVLRARFGFRWTNAHQAAFATYCAASKASTPLLPRAVRQAGPLALRVRRGEVGPFGVVNAGVRLTG